jgi:hypothetical protein
MLERITFYEVMRFFMQYLKLNRTFCKLFSDNYLNLRKYCRRINGILTILVVFSWGNIKNKQQACQIKLF